MPLSHTSVFEVKALIITTFRVKLLFLNKLLTYVETSVFYIKNNTSGIE